MNDAPTANTPQTLLFDLGGVVIDIDIDRMLDHWAPLSRLPAERVRERLVVDEAFERHERGEIGTAEYMTHLRGCLELDASLEQVVEGWNALLVGQIDETLTLIERLGERLPCYAFSNTSAVHREVWVRRFPRVFGAFQGLYLSYEMGMRKPDPDAFRAVAADIGVDPATVLFFDDMESNVTGARRAGMQAVQVARPADIPAALNATGLL